MFLLVPHAAIVKGVVPDGCAVAVAAAPELHSAVAPRRLGLALCPSVLSAVGIPIGTSSTFSSSCLLRTVPHSLFFAFNWMGRAHAKR
jgi:hypothetical protein